MTTYQKYKHLNFISHQTLIAMLTMCTTKQRFRFVLSYFKFYMYWLALCIKFLLRSYAPLFLWSKSRCISCPSRPSITATIEYCFLPYFQIVISIEIIKIRFILLYLHTLMSIITLPYRNLLLNIILPLFKGISFT